MHITILKYLRACALLFVLFPMGAHAQSDANGGNWLDVQKGKSLVLQIPKDTVNVSLTDDAVANVQFVPELQTLMLQGLSVGTTDLIESP